MRYLLTVLRTDSRMLTNKLNTARGQGQLYLYSCDEYNKFKLKLNQFCVILYFVFPLFLILLQQSLLVSLPYLLLVTPTGMYQLLSPISTSIYAGTDTPHSGRVVSTCHTSQWTCIKFMQKMNVRVSQGTATTRFRCGVQVCMYPVQNLVLFTPVKEF